MGGVMLPMPMFTPTIAAKCTGLTPRSPTTGTSRGVTSNTALTSSMSMPMMTMNTLIISMMIMGFSEIWVRVSRIRPGRSSMMKMRLRIMMQ